MSTREQQHIASQFVTARCAARALEQYPGLVPADLHEAYSIQNVAINQWSDQVAGWKVGRIPVHLEEQVGSDRLAGPIFGQLIHTVAGGSVTRMPVFEGGFGAVEAEYIVVIAQDAPADKTTWSLEESRRMIGDLKIGIEIASSPLATINELGPTVVVSDFGNNLGLLVGPSISNWASRELETLECETWVDGQSVGTGGAFTLTGGFLRSAQFMLELAAQLGRPLRRGDVIATGQTNGIHEVVPGQKARVVFGTDGDIACDIDAAQAIVPSGEST